jgi:hypothetical protein
VVRRETPIKARLADSGSHRSTLYALSPLNLVIPVLGMVDDLSPRPAGGFTGC